MRAPWLWIALAALVVFGGLGLWRVYRVERPRFLTIHEAVREGDLADVKYHLNHGANLADLDESGYTLLHSAAAYRRPKITHYLLSEGGEVDARDEENTPRYYTPLHLAARENSARVAYVLLRYGANPNAQDVDGHTPLHLAARHNSAEAARVLLQNGADVNARNNDADTPLSVAVKWEKLEVGRVLVQYGGMR